MISALCIELGQRLLIGLLGICSLALSRQHITAQIGKQAFEAIVALGFQRLQRLIVSFFIKMNGCELQARNRTYRIFLGMIDCPFELLLGAFAILGAIVGLGCGYCGTAGIGRTGIVIHELSG